jgi:hypothetical protein
MAIPPIPPSPFRIGTKVGGGTATNVLLVGPDGNVLGSAILTVDEAGGIVSIGDVSSDYTDFETDASGRLNIAPSGSKTGFNTVTAPSAVVHLPAGTAIAGTAPLKINSGVVNTTPEPGAIESDGTNIYWVNDAGVRKTFTIV